MLDIVDLTEETKTLLHIRVILPDCIFDALENNPSYVTLCLPAEHALELACDLQQLHSVSGLNTYTGQYMEEIHEYKK